MPWFLWMVVIGGAVAAAVSMASRAQVRKARAAWAAAADELGFAMVEGGHQGLAMAGTREELPVRIDVERRSSGDNAEVVTRYRVELPPLGVDLDLRKKTGWHGVLQLLGARDVEIDHEEFDTWFKLSTTNEARARRYLNERRVAALLHLSGQYRNVTLADGELRLESKGVTADPHRIVATANALIDAASVLVVPESEAPYVLLGDRVPEGSERVEVLEEIHRAIDDHVGGRVEAPVDAEPPQVFEPPKPSGPAPHSPDADRVAIDLFGERRLGFESEQRFDERYRDTTVTWTGTVQREGGYSAARMLGEEHTLVEVNVSTLEDDLYGTSSVDAVVALASGTPMPERGDTITFTGTLVGIDALTKDLFVANAGLG